MFRQSKKQSKRKNKLNKKKKSMPPIFHLKIKNLIKNYNKFREKKYKTILLSNHIINYQNSILG
jgi:hypothetical protein